ncbi:MAG: fibronectin type III domain-containing protein [Kiritimatiellae bacterium]|nr:fibronectin type III domain-containing protein [Kiritimatiellia bacterium]
MQHLTAQRLVRTFMIRCIRAASLGAFLCTLSGAAGQALKIMPVGDSNTWGVGNPAGTTEASQVIGYRKKLKDLLAASGVTVDFVGARRAGSDYFSDTQNEGYPGEGIDRIQTRVSQGMLATYAPDVLLLLIGSNDMWVQVFPAEMRVPISDEKAQYWVNRLAALVDDMIARRPAMHIIVAKPATPTNSLRPLGIYRAGIDQLVAARKASGKNIRSVDFMGAANDSVHYTVAGHEECARRWQAAILDVLAGQPSAPSAPGRLTATAISASRIDLSWADNSGDETGFKLDRRQSGTTDWVRTATLAANRTTCSDTALSAETRYYYQVKAYNAAGNSDYANVADATTPAAREADKIGWESLWRYRRGTAEVSQPVSAWCRIGFDDSAWAEGPAPFGYRTAGDWAFGTAITDMTNAYSCLFLRRTFTLANPAAVRELALVIRYDDGFVAWLNGEQIARVNMDDAALCVGALASGYVSDPPALWSATLTTDDMPALGPTNVLAVQVFNNSLASGDLILDARLSVLEGGFLSGTVDADADEMDDAWESACLGGTSVPNGNAEDDLDGDGVNNAEEFVAGTDPNDGSEFFAAAIELVAGAPVVSFSALEAAGPGYAGLARYYSLQQQPDPASTVWTDVPGKAAILGQGQRVTHPAAGDAACYRVRIWLE